VPTNRDGRSGNPLVRPIHKAMLHGRTTALLAILTGVALELGVVALSGRREAWDSSQYWQIGLPLAGVVSVALGYFSQHRGWAWTILLVPSQVFTMMVRNGEVGGLLPLALVLAMILSAPFVFLSFVGSLFRRRPAAS
jgi:hypothetical protein